MINKDEGPECVAGCCWQCTEQPHIAIVDYSVRGDQGIKVPAHGFVNPGAILGHGNGRIF